MDAIRHVKADGEVFEFLPESAIKTDYLKSFAFEKREQQISIYSREFSAVCPFSGLPDLATLTIQYFPDGGSCVELKSLKYYLTSFRNVGIYQEAVTKRIYEDLKALLGTSRLVVVTTYNTRGGFDTTCQEGSIYNPFTTGVALTGSSGNPLSGSGVTVINGGAGSVEIMPSGLMVEKP